MCYIFTTSVNRFLHTVNIAISYKLQWGKSQSKEDIIPHFTLPSNLFPYYYYTVYSFPNWNWNKLNLNNPINLVSILNDFVLLTTCFRMQLFLNWSVCCTYEHKTNFESSNCPFQNRTAQNWQAYGSMLIPFDTPSSFLVKPYSSRKRLSNQRKKRKQLFFVYYRVKSMI